jgi:hypothetical protein
MTEEDKIAAARTLLDSQLVALLMSELETVAVNGCVFAKMTDHDARAAFAAEVRAIRNLRGKLMALAGQANSEGKDAPA